MIDWRTITCHEASRSRQLEGTENRPLPLKKSEKTMTELMQNIRIQENHGARLDDRCFVDYMGLPQGEHTIPRVYKDKNPSANCWPMYKKVKLPDKTHRERRLFMRALPETTRLYAFAGGELPDGQVVKGCKVVILPALQARDGPYQLFDNSKAVS